MIDFNIIEIGDTFMCDDVEYVLTGKNIDENGNIVGVSYQPIQLSE